ncbi:MAG: protein kinase [Erysipelotrichaceae bacterium]|nr:protein kinase [Erysipelotrichaceae bacterium]
MNEIPKSCWPEWEIVEKIGSGSFGEVYKICRVDESKDYFDALKIIRIPKESSEVETLQESGIHDVDAYYEKYVENIFNEIDTMIQLGGNTNIVDYKDYKKIKRENEVGYDIYIRMELLTSLSEYRKHYTMSQDEILQMGIDICKALELCEKRNIVH